MGGIARIPCKSGRGTRVVGERELTAGHGAFIDRRTNARDDNILAWGVGRSLHASKHEGLACLGGGLPRVSGRWTPDANAWPQAMRRRTWRVPVPQQGPAARICLPTSIMPRSERRQKRKHSMEDVRGGYPRVTRRAEHGHRCETSNLAYPVRQRLDEREGPSVWPAPRRSSPMVTRPKRISLGLAPKKQQK